MASLVRSPLFAVIEGNTASTAFTNFALSASTRRVATVFIQPESATLTHAGFRYASRTGTPPTYQASLQAVNASGEPDGTPLASQTFTPPADATWNGTWQWVQFAASYNATRGQVLAIVIDYSSGTVDASNLGTFSQSDAILQGRPGLPYALNDATGSAWTKIAGGGGPIYGVKSGTAVYGCPEQNITTTTVSSAGHRAARKFTLPSGMASTYQLIGARVVVQAPAAGQTWIIGLWDAAGSVIQALTLDSDVASLIPSAQRAFDIYFDDAPVSLNIGTAYYIGVERVGSNVILYNMNVAAANDALAFPLGAASLLSTWDTSVWTDVDTSIPLVEPIFADMTATAGGGFVGIIGG